MTTDSKLASSYVQARNFFSGRRAPVRLVVIHTMEAPERSNVAEWCAQYFGGPGAPVASAHYMVDSDSIVQGVRESDTAFAAPGMNADGIQIEQGGYAGQGAGGWSDAYSKAMLDRTARLVADLCVRHNIPIRHLTNDQLRAGARGVVGHVQGSQVYSGDHSDPGPTFPWDTVIAAAQRYATGASPLTSAKQAQANAAPGKLAEDGQMGPATVSALQRRFKTPVDGVISRGKGGSAMVRALQTYLNTKVPTAHLTVDGFLGTSTNKALQSYLGTTADGVIGPKTVIALQRKLNAGKF